MARKNATVADDNVFIGDYAIKVNVFARDGILHYNTVFNMGILTNLYATEKDGVFDRTLDNASVCDKRIANDCAIDIGSGRGVTNLGEYGVGSIAEERLANFGL